MKPYLCKACDFATLTVSNIRCHIRKSHLKIKPYECELCKKRYNSRTLLEEHINIHTGVRPYRCNSCEFASASKQVLGYHVLTHKTEKASSKESQRRRKDFCPFCRFCQSTIIRVHYRRCVMYYVVGRCLRHLWKRILLKGQNASTQNIPQQRQGF